MDPPRNGSTRERERNQGGKVEAKVKEKNETNQVDENK